MTKKPNRLCVARRVSVSECQCEPPTIMCIYCMKEAAQYGLVKSGCLLALCENCFQNENNQAGNVVCGLAKLGE